MNKLKKSKGFTLIEMLVVIAIIAVLVSIIVPVVGNSTTKAKAAANAANLRSAATSIAIEYMEEKLEVVDEDTGELGGYTVDVPEAKEVEDIEGGDFVAKLVNGTVVCSYGEDGTVENYADVAADGKKDGNS